MYIETTKKLTLVLQLKMKHKQSNQTDIKILGKRQTTLCNLSLTRDTISVASE